VKKTATGYFRTMLVNNCWYLTDPEGCLFFTVGVNSVSKGGGLALPQVLREIGVNTLGCWSDETINDDTDHKMPYCPRWNFMATYKNSSQRTKDLFGKGIIPVFDPAFISFCDNHARQLASSKDDPWLLGHFSDNELPIYDNTTYGNLLDRFLAIIDKNDPNFLAADQWMMGRKGTGYKVTDDDREPFHGFVTGTYYRIVSEAIRRYDPNHLYLGSRLHGAAKNKPSIFIEAAKYVDMISINVYGIWTPVKSDMDRWSAGEKPFFVTEFYAKAEDSGLPNQGGAGWLVPTQADRARFFENFTLALIEHPGCVGFHYFRYIDDGEANKGLINGNYEWYEPLKSSFYKIARDIYGLREFMTGQKTGNRDMETPGSIRIYPNPTSGKVHISSFPEIIFSSVDIYSSCGEKIQCHPKIRLPFMFDLNSYPTGLYFVRLSSGNDEFYGNILKN